MSQVDFIIVMQELDLKSKCIIETPTFLLERVLVVADIFTVPVPANAASLLSFLLGVDERLHSLVVRTLRLDEVDEVELVGDILPHIGDSKVVPLGILRGVMIVLKDHVILILPDFNGSP